MLPVLAFAEEEVSCTDTIVSEIDAVSCPRFFYSVGGGAGLNHLFNIEMRGEKLVKRGWGGAYGLFVNSQANPVDSTISMYDRVFGFPTLEAGVQMFDYSHTHLHTGDTPYTSDLGCVWTAYIGFRRDVYRNRRWSFGYGLENGVSYCSHPYESTDNVDNDMIGQHLSMFFGCGIYAGYRVTPTVEVGLGVEYKHVSNGATDRPNKGANTYGLALRTRCDLNRSVSDPVLTCAQRSARLQAFPTQPFMPFFYLDANASVGFRTMYEEWILHRDYLPPTDARYHDGKLALHTVWNAAFVPMFRYNRIHASGVGLEYSFGGYAARSSLIEKECGITTSYRHSKHVLSISAHHEIYYKQLSVALSVGTYLFRQHGWVGHKYEPPVIETVGIRYYPKFFRPFYVGYNLKANLGKAYAMEVKTGLHIGRWNLRTKK